MTAEILRVMLAVCLLAMYIMAMLYLRRRRLSMGQLLAWGILALLLPALGPFLVLLFQPGEPAPRDISDPSK